MNRFTRLATALLVLGIVLLVVPALVPIQPVRYQNTRPGTTANRSTLEARGFHVVSYENLSARGQALYVRTLRSGGRTSEPLGQGAPDFPYPTAADLDAARNYSAQVALERVVIERPTDATLPPADEPVEVAKSCHRRALQENWTAVPSIADCRRQIARFDVMSTRTDHPPLTSPTSLAHLASVALGVVAIVTGGYLRSRP